MNQTLAPTTRAPEASAAWTGGRIAAIAIGTMLVLVSLVLLGAGGTALWADTTQREDSYVTTGVHVFSKLVVIAFMKAVSSGSGTPLR